MRSAKPTDARTLGHFIYSWRQKIEHYSFSGQPDIEEHVF
jgi:hypothetical protein